MKSISIFFPAHNEEANICQQVHDTVLLLDLLGCDYEVLVIDDDSTDNTADIVSNTYKDNPRVKLIHNDNPIIHTYGSALKKGFSCATKELIFFTDADRQFDIKELTLFLDKIDQYDYIIGYRIDRNDPIHRSLFAFLFTRLVNILFGIRAKDVDCAFKLFHKEVIDSITITSDSALINAEILYKLKKKQYSYTQIGVHHFARQHGMQTGANIKVITRALKELIALRLSIKE